MRIRQSVCMPIMRPENMPVSDFISLIQKTGFDAVEIWSGDEMFDEFAARVRDAGLAIASMSGHDFNTGLNDPSMHAKAEDELRLSIEAAARHRIPGIVCIAGNRRPGISDDAGIDNMAALLKRVAPLAEEKGINLNVEVLNSKVDHPGFQCDSMEFAVAVCREAGSPRVKILYDIYHAQIMEGDVIATIRENIDLIGHFHTAGVPGRGPIDNTQELNYAAICRAIADTPYDLYVGHEFKVPELGIRPALENAYATCNCG